jgi:putative tryptophan/tyrosine transport system substrate-binding protein
MKSVLQAFLSAVIAVTALHTSAAEPSKLPRIGGAVPVDKATDAPYQRALREGFRQLGYIDGKNIVLVWRYADGDPEKLRAIIKELVDMRVNVLMGGARQLKEATNTIPIVSMTMGDPVKTGLVTSLAHPGGNLTGLSAQSYDVWPKQLEFARGLVPDLTRIGFLFDTNDEPGALTNSSEFGKLAQGAGISVLSLPIRSSDDIHSALKTIHHERPQVVVIWSSPLLTQYRGPLCAPSGIVYLS